MGFAMKKRIYLGHDIPGYQQRLSKTIARYGFPKDLHGHRRRDLDFEAWDRLGYMQPSGAMYWKCYLYAALQTAELDLRDDLHTITILDKRWHFGERLWDFAPGKIKYRVQRSFCGLNYLVMIEFEVFRNVRYLQPRPDRKIERVRDQGRLITPHVQGFM